MVGTSQDDGRVNLPMLSLSEVRLTNYNSSQMVEAYAASEAAKPEMWGGRVPEAEEAQQLALCFAWEWNDAIRQMLRHWDTPPTTTGY
jgi:hypothetical protein